MRWNVAKPHSGHDSAGSVRITAQYKQQGYITSTFYYARNVSPHVPNARALAVMLHALLSQVDGRVTEGQ